MRLRDIRHSAIKHSHMWCITPAHEIAKTFSEVCEICGVELHFKDAKIDHCHKTGKFRGWLCHGCNVALGAVNESLHVLIAMANYINANLPE